MMPPAAKGLSDRPLETFGFESEEEEAIRRSSVLRRRRRKSINGE